MPVLMWQKFAKICCSTSDGKFSITPPYSPDLSPCDFHVFGPLKKALKGHRFTDNNEVRETVEEWFRTPPKTFFADGIHRLVDQWDTCFNQQGDYV